MPESWRIGPPATTAEWQAYFALRWQVLRAPWRQPRGSERDAWDSPPSRAVHCLVRDEGGAALGVGRLQRVTEGEGAIRYMAVAEDARGCGVGTAILAWLEARGREMGLGEISLNARSGAVGFYRRQGYAEAGPGPTLFGCITHTRMHKRLTP